MLADEDIQANWNEEDEEVEDRHEDLRAALQPHVPEEDAGQDVCGHQRVSNLPALPGSRRCHREETRRSRRRRTGPLPQDTPQDPCHMTTACPRQSPLTRGVKAGLKDRKTL